VRNRLSRREDAAARLAVLVRIRDWSCGESPTPQRTGRIEPPVSRRGKTAPPRPVLTMAAAARAITAPVNNQFDNEAVRRQGTKQRRRRSDPLRNCFRIFADHAAQRSVRSDPSASAGVCAAQSLRLALRCRTEVGWPDMHALAGNATCAASRLRDLRGFAF